MSEYEYLYKIDTGIGTTLFFYSCGHDKGYKIVEFWPERSESATFIQSQDGYKGDTIAECLEKWLKVQIYVDGDTFELSAYVSGFLGALNWDAPEPRKAVALPTFLTIINGDTYENYHFKEGDIVQIYDNEYTIASDRRSLIPRQR